MDGSHDRVGSDAVRRPVWRMLSTCDRWHSRPWVTVRVGPGLLRNPAPRRPIRVRPRHRPKRCTRRVSPRKSASPLEATVDLQRAADIARDVGNRWIQAFALTEVLWLEARHGRPREALARYIGVIDLWYRGGDWANQWLSLRHVFGILVQLRADLAAATLHGALTAAGSAYALPFEAADAERIHLLVDDVRERLGAADFAAAVRRGSSLSDGEIIEYVRAQIRALAPAAMHGS